MVIRALQVLGVRAKDGTGPIYPGSVADVDDKAAERFIAVGAAIKASRLAPVASIQAGDAPETGVNPSDTGTAGNEPADAGNEITDTEDLGKLEDMSFNQLKEIAKGLGIDTGKIKSKAGMIAAIEDVATGIPADGDVPPVFDAQEVIDE